MNIKITDEKVTHDQTATLELRDKPEFGPLFPGKSQVACIKTYWGTSEPITDVQVALDLRAAKRCRDWFDRLVKRLERKDRRRA